MMDQGRVFAVLTYRTIRFQPFLILCQVPDMSGRFDSLAAVLEWLAQMESNLSGMKQMRD
jgi:hypothetical protein